VQAGECVTAYGKASSNNLTKRVSPAGAEWARIVGGKGRLIFLYLFESCRAHHYQVKKRQTSKEGDEHTPLSRDHDEPVRRHVYHDLDAPGTYARSIPSSMYRPSAVASAVQKQAPSNGLGGQSWLQ
jgi:hypothetical protein